MAFDIHYKASVERDLKRLSKAEAKRVLDKIEKDLGKKPDKGEQLKGSFKGLYRYRIGDYRVIYVKTSQGILVLRVAHRKDVYRQRL